MRVIIAGSRNTIISCSLIEEAITASGFEVTEIVSGGCQGVDLSGEAYAESRKIPVKQFPADWKKYPGRGGPIRNSKMAVYADALIAFPGGSGTSDMIKKMMELGKPVFRWELK